MVNAIPPSVIAETIMPKSAATCGVNSMRTMEARGSVIHHALAYPFAMTCVNSEPEQVPGCLPSPAIVAFQSGLKA